MSGLKVVLLHLPLQVVPSPWNMWPEKQMGDALRMMTGQGPLWQDDLVPRRMVVRAPTHPGAAQGETPGAA